MLFHSTLIFLALGQVRPFEDSRANNMEITNEILTLLCCYSLIMFSNFVPDAKTRYDCGWQLIGIVLSLILFNLAIILGQSVASLCKYCKQKWRKR